MMKSHLGSGLFSDVLFLYKRMRQLGVKADSFTFPVINQAVSSLMGDVVVGQMVHCDAIKLGFGLDLYFCNTMINVHVKSGFALYARMLFDEMSERDLVSFTSMISGYVTEGDVAGAFALFNEMRVENMESNSVTMIVMLQGCSFCEHFDTGRQLHGYVIKNGVVVDVSVHNSILRMYSKIGCVKEVGNVFLEIDRKDVVSWNTLISFYLLKGDTDKVATGFAQMQIENLISSETLTLVSSMVAKMGHLVEGEKLHCVSIKLGLCDDILLTSLLDFYAKRGALRSSTRLFGEIRCRSSITWNAMMSGFIQNGCVGEAIGLFWQMQAAGVELGAVVIGSLIDGFTYQGSLRLGKAIHGYLIRNSFFSSAEEKMRLTTSMLNLYAKCGSISSARDCFDRMPIKDIVTWTSMIEGYAVHGLGVDALHLFHRMIKEGITPNSATFLSILSGCSHAGLVTEGTEMFLAMRWKFGVQPDLDHYTCIVDLLGRSGKLKIALNIIIKMVCFADSRIWGALLAASRVHGDKQIGDFAARRLLELEPDSVGYYTLLSNVEASSENWCKVEEVRRVMHEGNLKKKPGWSYIEGKDGNSCFISGDRSHNRSAEIYEVLGFLSKKVKDLELV